MKVTRRI